MALFGEPRIVEQQLEKPYINEGQIDKLRSATDFYFWLSAAFSLCVTVFAFRYLNDILLRISTVTNLTITLLIWRWTLSWPRIRRTTFRNLLSWPLANLFILILVALTGSSAYLTQAFIFLTVFSATLGKFREYVRLRRTLALEAQP